MTTDSGIVIIDYGMGNLRSVEKAFEHVGYPARVSSDPGEVERARGLVLPGVGAFRSAHDELIARGLREPIIAAVGRGIPYFGMCLGLQLLFDSSDEDGPSPGLGILQGNNIRFPQDVKCPHMGWNQVRFVKDSPMTDGIPDGSYFYFVHSYYPVPEDESVLLGKAEYAGEFCAIASSGNVFATQFHPEKSQEHGLRMIRNYGRFVGSLT